MNHVFPFGLAGETALYLVLYVVTLVIHVVFMNYVLAGSLYLAVATLSGRHRDQSLSADDVLRDWLPFALSAAITAGVAPLLFVQILYKQAFYTANVLLFHRWMAILPALLIGFYLLYLLKMRRFKAWSAAARFAITAIVFLCFAFTAYSWTENHLLAAQGPATWAKFYGEGRLIYRNRLLVPRLAIWFTGAFPTMAVLVGWQLYGAHRRSIDVRPDTPKRLASLAIVTLLLSAVSAVIYAWMLDEPSRHAVTGPAGLVYLIAAASGMLLQSIAWLIQASRPGLDRRLLTLASIGLAMTIIGATAVREVLRLAQFDLNALQRRTHDAIRVGGLGVFLAFFVVSIVVVVGCIVMVRRRMRSGGA